MFSQFSSNLLIFFSSLLMNLLLDVYMIDFIQLVMVFVIYHFEIDLVQVTIKIYLKNKLTISILGHSIEEVRGHELFLSDPKPVVNYNGLFGMFL